MANTHVWIVISVKYYITDASRFMDIIAYKCEVIAVVILKYKISRNEF